MNPRDKKWIEDAVRHACEDPFHTGVKKVQISNIGGTQVFSFASVSAYNLGYGLPKENGELLLYHTLKDELRNLFDVGSRNDTYYLSDEHIDYHLFEPDPKNIALFNQIINRIPPNIEITLNEVAVGNVNEYVEFVSKDGNGNVLESSSDETGDVTVKCIRLEDYCKESSVDFIDFLKIDVEGCEFEVIKGCGDLLNSVKYIQLEYGTTFKDFNITIADVTTYLDQYGFNCMYLLCDNGLIKIPPPDKDHYMMCNYLFCRDSDVEPLYEIIHQETKNPVYA